MAQKLNRVRVAVPVPVAEGFDYRWEGPEPAPGPGIRVRVPFGSRQRIGIVIEPGAASRVEDAALKAVAEVIDSEPLIDRKLMDALHWAADYYHHPVGEVLVHALPALLRQGRSESPKPEAAWELAADWPATELESLRHRAPRQVEALDLLAASGIVTAGRFREAGVGLDAVRRLVKKGWVVPAMPDAAPAETELAIRPGSGPAASLDEQATDKQATREKPPTLTPEQEAAVEAIRSTSGFVASLLYGVTGSGKTEVFLRLISDALSRDLQCLLLVPEIGLTPQLVNRLSQRFGCELAVFHSALTDAQRLQAWRRARSGAARLIVGTRSAVFSPLPAPGLIVVDEEHDPSYKQQSGFRYSGRDLAIMRAKLLDVPIVLASATPSLESFRNAVEGRYRLLTLPRRIGTGGTPAIRIIDLNHHAMRRGLSTPLLTAMRQHLDQGNQVLLFINRRGFAPVLFCPECEQASECRRCDARMTVHAGAGQLRCHHCGSREPLQWTCPDCGAERIGVGAGTERVTAELGALFPEFTIARLDRDVISGRQALGDALAEIESGRAQIIVGTQLLTKGHDFPSVTLVGVLNADQGLFGADFRSEERLAQTIVQVAGRAGRRELRGEVLIQTHYPNHPLLQNLLTTDYGAFAEHALAERRATGWPPFSHLAVFRAESGGRESVFRFLEKLKRHCDPTAPGVRILGPTADWMERRDARYRAQLLLQSDQRSKLHALIESCLDVLPGWPETRRVRWAIDVDPAEL
ncbi:MAG: primosomal protein N' [Gammaproteobacteria bacterium]|jgi:primosomal protein N' (replication factor Y)